MTATYDGTTIIISGTETLSSIFTQIYNPSVLSYSSSTNTYNLFKPIIMSNGTTFNIIDTKLIFNSSIFIQIKNTANSVVSLYINNASIDSTNGYGQFSIRGNVDIINSNIRNLGNGNYSDWTQMNWLYANGANDASSYHFNVTGNTIYDMYSGIEIIYHTDAIFDNNNCYNHKRTVLDCYNSSNGRTYIRNNAFTNNLNAAIYDYATAAVVIPSFDSIVTNNIIDGFGIGGDVAQHGFCAKEKTGVTYSYNTIKNGNGNSTSGIRIYDTWNQGGHPQNEAFENNISNVTWGICGSGGDNSGTPSSPSINFHDNHVDTVEYAVAPFIMSSTFENNIFTNVLTACNGISQLGDMNSGSNITWTNNSCNSVATTGSITGNVKNSTNTNISGAIVSDGTRQNITDVNGNYTLLNVPEGTYTLTVSATGYITQNISGIIVVPTLTTTKNFTLLQCPIPICNINITYI